MNRATGDPSMNGEMWGHRGSRSRTIAVSLGLHQPPCLLPIALLARAPQPSRCSGPANDPSFPLCLPAWHSVLWCPVLSVCLSVCSQLLLWALLT